jgi:hypothetical protein
MDNAVITDLKLYIASTVDTAIGTAVDSLSNTLRQEITTLSDRIDARFDDNDTVLNEVLNVVGEIQEAQGRAIRLHADHIDNHEHRITKLEKRTV